MPTSSVISASSSIFGGIFTTEPGQRLLTIAEFLTKRGFEGLYDKCATNVTGAYYQTGLRRVHLWSDNVIEEDIDFVRTRCPDMEETYEACFVNYIAERYSGGQRPTIHCPPIATFVRRFLESVAQQEAVTNGEFFANKDPLMRRITCMDAARSALYALVTSESLRIELASEVSHARRNLSETRPQDLGTYQRAQQPRARDYDASTDVKPEDSVSQVESVRSSRAPPPQPSSRPPPPPPSPPRSQRGSSSRGAEREEEDDDTRSVTVISTRGERERRRDTPTAPPSVVSRREPSPPPPARREDPDDDYENVASPPPGSQTSRHDFSMRDDSPKRDERSRSPRDSVASLRTRSVVGSAVSSVSIGMKRMKSPRN